MHYFKAIIKKMRMKKPPEFIPAALQNIETVSCLSCMSPCSHPATPDEAVLTSLIMSGRLLFRLKSYSRETANPAIDT